MHIWLYSCTYSAPAKFYRVLIESNEHTKNICQAREKEKKPCKWQQAALRQQQKGDAKQIGNRADLVYRPEYTSLHWLCACVGAYLRSSPQRNFIPYIGSSERLRACRRRRTHTHADAQKKCMDSWNDSAKVYIREHTTVWIVIVY